MSYCSQKLNSASLGVGKGGSDYSLKLYIKKNSIPQPYYQQNDTNKMIPTNQKSATFIRYTMKNGCEKTYNA